MQPPLFLRALAFPFHLTSLLFVGFCGICFAILRGNGNPSLAPLTLLGTYLLLSWLNKYAFALLDQAAHGEREAPVASVELLGPFGDPRAWVHPLLICAAAACVSYTAQPWATVTLALAALLFPLSVGSLVVTDRIVDALNPVELWRTLCGLGTHYLWLLLCEACAALLGLLLLHWPLGQALRFASLGLLMLCLYAAIGGALYERRNGLGFIPRRSPERIAEADDAQRERERQQVIDAAYTAIRVRATGRARATLDDWLNAADDRHLPGDVDSILAQSAVWPEPRDLALVARVVIARCVARDRPALGLQAAEAALTRMPGFAPDTAAQGDVLATFAAHTGRPRLAQTLRDNAAVVQQQALSAS